MTLHDAPAHRRSPLAERGTGHGEEEGQEEGQEEKEEVIGIPVAGSHPESATHCCRPPVRSAPMPAATTKATPAAAAGPGTWCSARAPINRAAAGSRLISVPNAAAVSRRSASNSKQNGTTGSSSA